MEGFMLFVRSGGLWEFRNCEKVLTDKTVFPPKVRVTLELVVMNNLIISIKISNVITSKKILEKITLKKPNTHKKETTKPRNFKTKSNSHVNINKLVLKRKKLICENENYYNYNKTWSLWALTVVNCWVVQDAECLHTTKMSSWRPS